MLKLDVLNMALQRAGQPVATSLTESKQIRTLALQFKHSIKAVLCAHPWDIVKLQVSLTPNTTTPELYSYAFDLPKNFCRLIEEEPTGYEYDLANNSIYANTSTFGLSYVAYPYAGSWATVPGIATVLNWVELPDTSVIFDSISLPDTLIEAVALHMVSKCVYVLTGDTGDIKTFLQLYSAEIAKCKSNNAQQKRDMFIEATTWEDSRL